MKNILHIIPLILAFHSSGSLVKDSLVGQDSISEENTSFIDYDYENPYQTYSLPEELKEISGISMVSASEVACIGDEQGILYIFDLAKNKIREKIKFGPDGDYEGVAINKQDAYILRSDGEIYHIANLFSKEKTIEEFSSGVPAQDSEGVVYDSIQGGLLIACKGKFGKGLVNQLRREIYVFDPDLKKLHNKFLFSINIDSCISFAHSKNIQLPTKVKNDSLVEVFKFRMSGLAIHPQSGDFYILSAFDHAVLVFSEEGELKDIRFLNKNLFPKAEGITFLTNGDMLISNEGDGNTQNILHLKSL